MTIENGIGIMARRGTYLSGLHACKIDYRSLAERHEIMPTNVTMTGDDCNPCNAISSLENLLACLHDKKEAGIYRIYKDIQAG
jgi:hypothetical protein